MSTQRLYSGQDVIVTNPMAERTGSRGHLYATSSDGYGSVEFPGGILAKYPLSALSAVPSFKAGDRVTVKETGKVTVVCAVWKTEDCKQHGEPAVMYETADAQYLDVAELELAPEPKREPKAGEVWRFANLTIIVTGERRGISTSGGHMQFVDGTWDKLSFLADSVQDAVSLGLL